MAPLTHDDAREELARIGAHSDLMVSAMQRVLLASTAAAAAEAWGHLFRLWQPWPGMVQRRAFLARVIETTAPPMAWSVDKEER